jgi:Zn-dependent alcohol dehydrogenase
VEISVDLGVLNGDVAVELDLLGGVGVSALAAAVLAGAPRVASTRVVARRRAEGELRPPEVAAAAAAVASEVRVAVHDRRPSMVHMFCAAPVEFAILVGSRLTSLHAKVQLYERDGERYLPSLLLDC